MQRLRRWLRQDVTLLFLKALVAALLLLTPSVAAARVLQREVTLSEADVTTVDFPTSMDAVSATLPLRGDVWIRLSGRWVRLLPDPDQDPTGSASQLVFFEIPQQHILLWAPAAARITIQGYDVANAPLAFSVATTSPTLPRVAIIPREVWGADETLRLARPVPSDAEGHAAASATPPNRERDPTPPAEEKPAETVWQCLLRQQEYPEEFAMQEVLKEDELGRELTWPLQYSDRVDLIIVHHTAESLENATSRTGVERVRALYEYHAIGRGWGDIGYHFLIDEVGKIYEGRAGGPGVVGGHTYCANVGTVSVALLGDFSKQRPTHAQVRALRLLAATLLDLYAIDPESEVVFHGQPLPRIVGHRALSSTACPGPYLEEILPQVRLFAASRDLALPVYSSVLPETTQHLAAPATPLPSLTLGVGERKHLLVRLKNLSGKPWTAETWLQGSSEGGITFPQLHPGGFVAGTLTVAKAVGPQKEAPFEVDLQAGMTPGVHSVSLIPVANGKQRLTRDVMKLSVTVLAEDRSFRVGSVSFPTTVKEGQDLQGTVTLRNSGTLPWIAEPPQAIVFTATDPVTAHLLQAPAQVLPGESGTFTVSLQHLTAGEARVELQPRFADGTPLEGAPIVVKTSITAAHIPEQAEAEAQITTSAFAPKPKRTPGGRLPPPPHKDQYLIEGDEADLQLFERPTYDLFPRERIRITAYLRSKGEGIARDAPLFPVERSDSSLLIFDVNQRRIGSVYLSPVALLPFSGARTEFTMLAPRKAGSYTLTIGDRLFNIRVREDLRRPTRRRISRTVDRTPAHTTAPPGSAAPSVIRIRLSFAQSTAILQVSTRASLEGEGPTLPVEGPVRLSKEGSACSATVEGKQEAADVLRILPAEGAITTILNWPQNQSEARFTAEDRPSHRYRGVIECRVLGGSLVLINELPIEDYLLGLSEEPDTQPWQKQRAFAIAARSYATYYLISGEKKFPGQPYDGSDDPATFQAYGGVSFEEGNPQWARAVLDTAGKLLTYEGLPIKPPYFTSDDGSTRSPREAGWGDWPHAPYLSAKPDPWCRGLQLRGHGVGMSGCGSEAQAKEGKTAEEILQYYYPGTTIEKR